jgi:mono/diheme cytochrome c family protein
MKSTRRTRGLALASALGALASLGGLGCRGYESEEPPIHLVRNMDTQEKGKAYREDTTGLFADGRMMRPPVPGTVAQGQLDEDDHFELGLDEKGVTALKFPDAVKVDGQIPEALAARGESRYQIYCAPCHGKELDGLGPLAKVGFDSNPRLIVPPPSMHSDRVKKSPVGRIYGAIKNGVNGGNMSSYAAQIPTRDRWAIVAYIRAQQKAKDPTVDPEGGEVVVVAAATVASADHGSQLYVAKGCNACHTLDGNKLVGPSFKGLYGAKRVTSGGEVEADMAYLSESMLEPTAKVVEGYPPVMPKIALTTLEIESLSLYIQTLK